MFPRTCHSPQGNFFSENCVETSFVSSCELGPPCDKVWTWIYVVLTSRDRSNAIAISATIISAPVVGLRCFIVYYLNVPHEQYLKSTANDWPTDRPPGCPVPTSSLRRNNFSGFLSVWVLLACHVTSVGTIGAPDGFFFFVRFSTFQRQYVLSDLRIFFFVFLSEQTCLDFVYVILNMFSCF